MNQHKKIWLLLFILTFMFSCFSVSALATEITPEQVQKIIDQQAAASRAAMSTASSTAPVNSSKKSTVSRVYHSSQASSGDFSQQSSGVSSEISSSSDSSGQSSEIVLPSVNSVEENNPLSSVMVDSDANRKMNWIGILSWACIALGVIVIVIVVLSNRRPPRGGPGRKRYRRPGKTNKKRLLNEKYYRHTKY
ncbi:MAG: hypothetical protein K0Q85_1396 [Caproiciproducens sp.]|nr:hypothetical protein [Caproiciproducens sp.]